MLKQCFLNTFLDQRIEQPSQRPTRKIVSDNYEFRLAVLIYMNFLYSNCIFMVFFSALNQL